MPEGVLKHSARVQPCTQPACVHQGSTPSVLTRTWGSCSFEPVSGTRGSLHSAAPLTTVDTREGLNMQARLG